MNTPEQNTRPTDYVGSLPPGHNRDLLHHQCELLGLFSPTPYVVLARTAECLDSECSQQDKLAWIACSSLTAAKAYVGISEASGKTRSGILVWYNGNWVRIHCIADTTVEPVEARVPAPEVRAVEPPKGETPAPAPVAADAPHVEQKNPGPAESTGLKPAAEKVPVAAAAR